MNSLPKLPSGRDSGSRRTSYTSLYLLQIILVCLYQSNNVQGWGNDDDSQSSTNMLYGDTLNRDWLYNSNSISLQLEGCVWGYASDHDDADCMENGSQDGTTYWYQMANCRRAQAVYRMYATSSGSASCTTSNFKESVCLLNIIYIIFLRNATSNCFLSLIRLISLTYIYRIFITVYNYKWTISVSWLCWRI